MDRIRVIFILIIVYILSMMGFTLQVAHAESGPLTISGPSEYVEWKEGAAGKIKPEKSSFISIACKGKTEKAMEAIIEVSKSKIINLESAAQKGAVWRNVSFFVAEGKEVEWKDKLEVAECIVSTEQVYESITEGKEGAAGKEGKEGKSGTSYTWTGEWKSSKAYSVNELVSYEGSSYVCIKAMTSGEDSRPPSENWSLIAKIGAEGKEGKEGKSIELTAYKEQAEEDNEVVEIMGWCVIGTLLGLSVGFMIYKILRVDPR
jgi:hypothetical protein